VVEEEEEEVEDREENEDVEDEDGDEEEEEAPRPRPLFSLLLAPPQALLASLALVWSRMSSVAVRYFSSSVQGRLTGRFCWLEPPLALPFQGLSVCTTIRNRQLLSFLEIKIHTHCFYNSISDPIVRNDEHSKTKKT